MTMQKIAEVLAAACVLALLLVPLALIVIASFDTGGLG